MNFTKTWLVFYYKMSENYQFVCFLGIDDHFCIRCIISKERKKIERFKMKVEEGD